MKDMNGIAIYENDWITDGYGFGKVLKIDCQSRMAWVEWSDSYDYLMFWDCYDITVVKNRQAVLDEIATNEDYNEE